VFAIHVGDGRIYHVREGALTQLSTDHTYLQQELAAGRLEQSEADDHPLRNVLTRSFLGDAAVELDHITGRVQRGDAIVLCTDGVWKSRDGRALLESLAADPSIADEIFSAETGLKRFLPRPADHATLVVARVL